MHKMHRLTGTLAAGLLAWAAPAASATWIEQAQADLTCSGMASAAEQQALAAPVLPVPLDARSVSAYFRGSPRDERHARFRHLTALAAIGWWADQVNDQALRSDVYLNIGVLADRYAADTGDAAFQQAARCARAHLIDANLELERYATVHRLADNLAKLYPAQLPANSIEDWPLLLALRAVSIEPRSRTAIALLGTRAATIAGSTMPANQGGERSSRLLAATSRGLMTLGETTKARDLALQSLIVTGKPPTASAAWRAMPVLYDAARVQNGATDAANLQALLRPDQPPAELNDQQAAFESLLRLSMAAETKEQYDDMGRLAGQAFAMLGRMRGLERYPMPFYRHALDELAATRSEDLGTLARNDPAFGAKTLATYTGLYDSLLRQAQNQFVGDAREQAFFQYKIDNNLHAQTELYPAIPRSQAEIADSTFRLAQLRSFGRLTLATLSAEIDRARIDPASRGQVERFFMMTTQSSDFLRDRLESIRIAPGGAPPDGEALWKVFFPLGRVSRGNGKAVRQVRRVRAPEGAGGNGAGDATSAPRARVPATASGS